MRRQSALATLAVVAVVLTAGCSGLGGGGTDREPYDVPSATPSPTPTPEPTATTDAGDSDGTVVPGVAPDRVTSVLDAVTAHTTALTNTSFEVRRSTRLELPNGSGAGTTWMRALAGENGTKYVVHQKGGTTRRVYIGPETGYVRTERDGGVAYERENDSDVVLDPDSPIRFDLTYKSQVYRYLRAVDDATVEAVGNGSYRVASDDVDANYVDILVRGDATNVTVSMVIGPDGLVEAFRTSYTLRREGTVYEVGEVIQFTGVGETSVPPPEWLSEAERELDGE
jgi:hypothetical protein